MKKNNEILSVMKGIAIMVVVMVHCLCPGEFFNFTSYFNLPIFYFAIGYFFKESYLQNPFDFVKRKFKGLYLTFVKWQLAFILLHNVFAYFHICKSYYGINEVARRCFSVLKFVQAELLLMPFWYIVSAFVCVFLYFIIRYIVNLADEKNRDYLMAFFMIVSFVIGIILKKVGFITIYYIESSFILILILYFGEMFKKHEKQIPVNVYIASGCFLCLCLLTYFSGISIVSADFWDYWQFYLGVVAGIYLIYYISIQMLACGKLKKIFVTMGNESLYILGLHLLSFKIVDGLKILMYGDLTIDNLSDFTCVGAHHNIAFWLLYTIVGVSVPLVIKNLLDRLNVNVVKLLK
ncbi:Fucose 4-O-acetylase [Bacteroidales bacterium KHT7]|nr:Fucose 4-O-acetylase [Bacteroidales bacterium KHT7]